MNLENKYFYVWSNKMTDGKVHTDKDVYPPFHDRNEAIAFAEKYFHENEHLDVVEVFEFGVERAVKVFER